MSVLAFTSLQLCSKENLPHSSIGPSERWALFEPSQLFQIFQPSSQLFFLLLVLIGYYLLLHVLFMFIFFLDKG